MRYLAIDLGDRRTGLAVGTDVTRQPEPWDVIETPDPDAQLRAVADAIETCGPDALVLGLPLNMDGSGGPRAEAARAFANQLSARFSLPVHLVDERLTSDAADQQMARTGLTRAQKKRRRDALAAAAILQDFFNRQ